MTSLYWYGMALGLGLLKARRFREAAPLLIRPVNYWRHVEYAAVLRHGEFSAGQRVLDIGSPKLLAVYLAERAAANVVATDIEDYFIPRFAGIRAQRKVAPERLDLRTEDGRALGFPSDSFERVYSISVLEHIPGDGDSACAQEIGRVLRRGGRCVLTVPFAVESRDEFTKAKFYWDGASTADERGTFYQRRYSETDLYRRLVEPSGLKLERLEYIGDRIMAGSEREFSDLLPAVTGPVQPALSWLIHTRETADWRALAKPLCAIIVLGRT